MLKMKYSYEQECPEYIHSTGCLLTNADEVWTMNCDVDEPDYSDDDEILR